MPRPGISDDEREQIRAGHAAGKSCNEIARELGRSASTVSRAARDLGLSWDASRSAAATEAKQASNRARRARLVQRMYDRADKIMDRLEADQFKLVGVSKDGLAHTNVIDADAIPGAEERALFGMVVNALNGAARLEAVDAADSGAAEGKGILGQLDTALQGMYAQLSHAGSTPTAQQVEAELEAEQ